MTCSKGNLKDFKSTKNKHAMFGDRVKARVLGKGTFNVDPRASKTQMCSFHKVDLISIN